MAGPDGTAELSAAVLELETVLLAAVVLRMMIQRLISLPSSSLGVRSDSDSGAPAE